jgi:hypothetical protein
MAYFSYANESQKILQLRGIIRGLNMSIKLDSHNQEGMLCEMRFRNIFCYLVHDECPQKRF